MWRVITETKQEAKAKQENAIMIYYQKMDKYIKAASANFEIIHHYLYSLEFFAACTKDKLCQMREKSTLHKLFLEHGRRIYTGFHPFVCAQREKTGNPLWLLDLEEYLSPYQDKNDNAKKRCNAYFGL